MNSVGPETIAVAKGPAGLMEAVMERLEEQTAMSVLQSQVKTLKTKLTLRTVSRHFKTYFQTENKTIICEKTQTFGVKWKNEKGPGSKPGRKSDSKHFLQKIQFHLSLIPQRISFILIPKLSKK